MSRWIGLLLALGFAILITPSLTAGRWLGALGVDRLEPGHPAPITVRVAPFAGHDTHDHHVGGGGIVVARGSVPDLAQIDDARAIAASFPRGALPYVAVFALMLVFGAIFTHHMRRSTHGRLLRVQLVTLATIALLAAALQVALLTTAVSILAVPVALLAMIATMVFDRIVGLATGVLAALVASMAIPFDVSVAILLLVQASVAGLVIAERPKDRWRAALFAGAISTLCTAATYLLLSYLTTGVMPALAAIADPWRSPAIAAALGPAIATVLAAPLLPVYQLLVGEITQNKLIELEDLSHPLLRQIAEKAPGTWQHSLMMANLAEIAANAIGANGRLVRVGAYYHDLGKSLQPKYFIENLEPGETSPHDQLPPEVSCDAIFAHVTEGLVAARKAGLHERIVDFMHMHHGNGVLEYFWGKTREQGNPRGLSIEQFRYPGHPPQSRETAILAICDAVEAASRTLKKPEPAAIDALVQRIVYGKLHLGQLDESGLSMSDLRRVSDSLRETIRHANHGRTEYPWQTAQQDASASPPPATSTAPRLDSLDRVPRRDTPVAAHPAVAAGPDATATARRSDAEALADTADSGPFGRSGAPRRSVRSEAETIATRRPARTDAEALAETADLGPRADGADPRGELGIIETAPALPRPSGPGQDASGLSRDSSEVGRGSSETGHGSSGQRHEVSETGRGLSGRTRESSEAGLASPGRTRGSSDAGRTRESSEAGRGSSERMHDSSGRTRESSETGFASSGRTPDTSDAGHGISGRTRDASEVGHDSSERTHESLEPGRNLSDRTSGAGRSTRESSDRTRESSDRTRGSSDRTRESSDRTRGSSDRTREPSADRTRESSGPSGRGPGPSTGSPLERARGSSGRGEGPSERGRGPLGPPPEVITPSDFERSATSTEAQPTARKRASSGPPTPPPRRAPTVPPPVRRPPTVEHEVAPTGDQEREAAAPHGGPRTSGPATRLPALIVEEDAPRSYDDLARRITNERAVVAAPEDPSSRQVRSTSPAPAAAPARRGPFIIEAAATAPSMPAFAEASPFDREPAWSSGLAARVDRALEGDEWSTETPVVAPSKAELRALLGAPDPTRQQSLDEIEALHRRAEDLEPELHARRPAAATAEVDPDDIEAAIELAPPARRSAIAVAKPRKPE